MDSYQSNPHLPQLDVMRACSLLAIVLYHHTLFASPQLLSSQQTEFLLQLFGNFWIGVDAFFVLSGFLLAQQLMQRQKEGQPFGMKSFFIRRFFRLVPVYYAVLAIIVLWLLFFGVSGPFPLLFGTMNVGELLESLPAHLLYANNYWVGLENPGILPWSWSLCIEVHFYILLPFLLKGLFSLPASWRLWGLLALLVLSPLLRLWTMHPEIQPLYEIYPKTHLRLDGLMTGVVVAYGYVFHHEILKQYYLRFRGLFLAGTLACLAMVPCYGSLLDPATQVWQFSAAALGWGGCLWSLLMNQDSMPHRSQRFWTFLAQVSYSSYLIHPFLLFGLLQTGDMLIIDSGLLRWMILFIMELFLTLIIARFFYIFLEFPFQQWGRHITNNPE